MVRLVAAFILGVLGGGVMVAIGVLLGLERPWAIFPIGFIVGFMVGFIRREK